MRLSGLKIAVLGGRGYVGSHTAKSLLAAGAEVFIVDNRYVSQNKVKGTKLYGMGNYDDPVILNNLRDAGVDGIVHCAGTSLVGPSVNYPSEYYNNNVIRTIRMLDHLKTWGKPPFIVFSSSAADVWSSSLGPEPGDTHIIPRIFEAYYANKPFELYGTNYDTKDGTCIRDYIHVCDIASAHLTAVYDSRTYNDSLRTYRFDGTDWAIVGSGLTRPGDVTVIDKSRREGDPDRLIANANKFTRQTSWNPEFSDLETIINSYRDYYEKSKRRI